jgi:hypothetical protein
VTPLLTLLGLCPIAVTLGYALVCVASPFGPCRYCAGHPRRRYACTRCDGTGLRQRTGVRLYAEARRAYRDSTR